MLVLKVLLIILLLLLPFGELLRFSIGNNIYIKPLDITAGLLFLYLLGYLTYKKRVHDMLQWRIWLFPSVGLLSLILNSFHLQTNEFIASLLYLIRLIAYIGIIFAVLQLDQRLKKKIEQLVFLDGLAIVLIGYFQYFFYSDIRHLIAIGWDEHMYRLFSAFYDPNFAGAILVLYLLFVAGLLYVSLTSKRRKESFFFSAVLLLTLGAIFLTFSRSALIMLVISSGTVLVLLNKKKLILGLFAILALYIIVISPRFYIENTNLFRTVSSEARLESYANAFAIYQDNPLFGVGFNAYRYAQHDYGFRNETPKYPSNADSGVDNSFLLVLATTGIIGFGAYLLFWGTLIANAIAHIRQKQSIRAKIFIASVVGLFINAFFINSLFFPAILLWVLVMFGLIHQEE